MADVNPDSARNSNAANAVAIVAGFMGVFGIWATGWPVIICSLITAFIIGSITVLAVIQDQKQLDMLADWIDDGGLGWGYRRLIGRTMARTWHRYCRPAPAHFRWYQTLGAAFTWRLYDLAMGMAIAYPILAMIIIWLFTGAPSGFDDDPFLHRLEIGSVMHVSAVFLAALWLAVIVIGLRDMNNPDSGDWGTGEFLGFPLLITCAALIWSGILTVAIEQLLQGASTIFGVIFLAKQLPGKRRVTMAGATFVMASALFSLLILAPRTGTLTLSFDYIYRFLMMLILGAALWALYRLSRNNGRWIVPVVATLAVPCIVIAAAANLNWMNVNDRSIAIFLFFMVLPLINALFDVVSYGITIALVRMGLRTKYVPGAVFGVIDLFVAAILFFCLGATLVVVAAGLNALANAPIVDLGRILAQIQQGPSGETAWIYVMVCSTLLPTIVHFGLALLSVERAILPFAKPYANLLRKGRDSVLHGGAASLAGGLVLSLPVAAAWVIGWCIWSLLGDVISTYADAYVQALIGWSVRIGAL